MNILLIDGSPREGNSAYLLKSLHGHLRGHSCKLIKLSDLNIRHCTGCLICEDGTESPCTIQDDMIPLYKIITEANIVVVATPIYMNNVPGVLKNFFDRINYYCDKLHGVKLGLISVGQLEGELGQQSKKRIEEFFIDISGIFGFEYVGSMQLCARNKDDLKSGSIDINALTKTYSMKFCS